MVRSDEHKLPLKSASYFRRSFLIVLAFVYLFVGIAHNVFCADQTLASNFTVESDLDITDHDKAKSALSICDHCPACTPCLLPLPAMVTNPSAVPAQPAVTPDTLRMTDHSQLDTPPPKHLT